MFRFYVSDSNQNKACVIQRTIFLYGPIPLGDHPQGHGLHTRMLLSSNFSMKAAGNSTVSWLPDAVDAVALCS
jgi:hypothetical protein